MRTFLAVLAMALVALAEVPEASAKIYRDVSYVDADGWAQRLTSLDIYAPDGQSDASPVVVFVHGGGWRRGDKSAVNLKPGAFAAAGYVFVSVNYRLAPAVSFPVYAQDVGAAVAWVVEHIGEYGGDADRVFIMGHSAGAHLVALIGTDGQYLEAAGATLQDIEGVIPLDGAGYNIPAQMAIGGDTIKGLYRQAFGSDPSVWEAASPMLHVEPGKNIPPFLIIHAGERIASRIQSNRLAETLRGAGVAAQVVSAPDKNHMTLNRELGAPGDKPTEVILKFLGNPAAVMDLPTEAHTGARSSAGTETLGTDRRERLTALLHTLDVTEEQRAEIRRLLADHQGDYSNRAFRDGIASVLTEEQRRNLLPALTAWREDSGGP